jgi:hypothetical protein
MTLFHIQRRYKCIWKKAIVCLFWYIPRVRLQFRSQPLELPLTMKLSKIKVAS